MGGIVPKDGMKKGKWEGKVVREGTKKVNGEE